MISTLLMVVLLPAALVPLLFMGPGARRWTVRAAPWSAVPALAAGLTLPSAAGDIEWLLLGARVGLDTPGRVVLVLAAAVWTAAGAYAASYLTREDAPHRYFAFHLLAASGNLGAAVALDLVGFYLFYSLMTFAAYGMVVHARTAEARRAGAVYIWLSAIGEGALLAGVILVAGAAGGLRLDELAAALPAAPYRTTAAGLLIAGFGLKAGLFPLHLWLPLAHPIAPTPASAVLSGCMIKVGLLGLLRLLPLGEAAVPPWGIVLVALGVTGAIYAVLVGVLQDDPKTVLAYSSISQMGIVLAGFGAALLEPRAWALMLPAVLLYLVHHGLVKSALFLGVGVARAAVGRVARRLTAAGLAFGAVALAGAPFTSGALAKEHLKHALHGAPPEWIARFDLFLPLASAATALLMARFLVLFRSAPAEPEHEPTAGLWAPWVALLALALVLPWAAPAVPGFPTGSVPVTGAALWGAVWPLLAGALVFALAVRVRRRVGAQRGGGRVPPGDLLVLAESVVEFARRRTGGLRVPTPPDPIAALAARWYGIYAEGERQEPLYRAELVLTRWAAAGVMLLAVIAVFMLVLVLA